ncbi:hypothetical protein BRADI_4g38176v3 [Brachypodium distachyon]|uniref:DUF295 domain-containing protein n=1 Tax=Brachypodium distachyon TaxID=15368 RepID=A0A0Q3IZJ1_BRADI|nr:hypothetical protein BRADI_4g38176v3 [Brachypodium distachyon]
MTTAARQRLAPNVPWANLPPELLSDVTSHLHDAADFVRFHAVCKPWRHSAAPAPSNSKATSPSFMPWLLAPCNGQILHSVVPFSGRRAGSSNDIVVRAVQPLAAARARDNISNCVAASAHATAAWLFTPSPEPRLDHLFTGAVISLPRLPVPDDGRGVTMITEVMGNPHVIVYGDGTVFLHCLCLETDLLHWKHADAATPVFMAAVLRPGDAAWTVVKNWLDARPHGRVVAAYHDGRVLACARWLCSWRLWCLPVPVQGQGGDNGGGGGGEGAMLVPPWDARKQRECDREDSYLLESRGELMWASVLAERGWRSRYAAGDTTLPASALHVTVHALEGPDGWGRMGSAARDGRSLGDRVLFLGYPASFALAAAPLGVPGGCAYFVFKSGVYRYGFDDGEAKLVRRLGPGWGTDGDGTCVWLRPQPRIAPIEEIRERLARVLKEEQLNSDRT